MPSVDSRLSLRLELAEIPLIKQPPIRNHRHALESRPSIVAPTKKTTLVPTSSREEANRGREGEGGKPLQDSIRCRSIREPVTSRSVSRNVVHPKDESIEHRQHRGSTRSVATNVLKPACNDPVTAGITTSSFYRSITSIHRVTIARGAGRARRVRVVGWLISTWVP